MAALNKEGVPTALHYPKSLTRQPAFKHIVEQNGGHEPPVALKLSQTIFCIPIHQNLTDEQAHGVCDAIEKVAGVYRK
jgi:UDP-2-acetamido-2-deoxy-ribo-hexuluronate aminotransferase